MTLDATPDSNSQAQDLCDYSMSDLAICEARRVGLSPGLPYGIGFRRSTLPRHGRPTLREINALPDEQFRKFIQNGCKFPSEARAMESPSWSLQSDARMLQALQTEMATLQAYVRSLTARVEELTRGQHPSVAPTRQRNRPLDPSGQIRGLDVDAR